MKLIKRNNQNRRKIRGVYSPDNLYNKYFALFIITVLIFLLSTGGVNGEKEEVERLLPRDKIGVVVTILPLANFVEQVGKDRVEVRVMVPPGASPHTYEPTPSQLKGISQAQLYVKIGSGIDFELAWMDKIRAVNRDMWICDSSLGIKIINNDPHIWLSPKNAQKIVQNIGQALIQIDPLSREYFEENVKEFNLKLDELDKEIRIKINEMKNKRFLTYHPSWTYFAKEYNLIQMAIEEEGKEPSAASLVGIIKQARANQVSIILCSPQFNIKSAEVIAKEIGAKIITADPLARDYINSLQILARALGGNEY